MLWRRLFWEWLWDWNLFWKWLPERNTKWKTSKTFCIGCWPVWFWWFLSRLILHVYLPELVLKIQIKKVTYAFQPYLFYLSFFIQLGKQFLSNPLLYSATRHLKIYKQFIKNFTILIKICTYTPKIFYLVYELHHLHTMDGIL